MNSEAIAVLFSAYIVFWTGIVALSALILRAAGVPKPDCRRLVFRGIKVLHGCMAFLICATVYSRMLLTDQLPPEYLNQAIVLFSGSFYFFDLIFALWMRMANPSLVIHHVISIIQVNGWVNQPAWLYFTAMTLLEASVGPQNFRELLRDLRMRFTKLFIVTEQLFFYSILVSRGALLVPVAIIPIWYEPSIPLLLKINAGVVGSLSYYYCYQVFGKLQRRQKQLKQMQQKGVEFGWLTTEQSTLKQLSFAEGKQGRQN